VLRPWLALFLTFFVELLPFTPLCRNRQAGEIKFDRRRTWRIVGDFWIKRRGLPWPQVSMIDDYLED